MSRRLPEGALENLGFLCVEIDSQLRDLERYLVSPSVANYRRILDRSGYASNLRMRIHSRCSDSLARRTPGVGQLALHSISFIATDLDRIAEKCRDAVGQLVDINDLDLVQPAAVRSLLKKVRRGVRMIEPAVSQRDSARAVELGRLPATLDHGCQELVDTYIDAMKAPRKPSAAEELTRAMFLVQSVRQMGDSLRRSSESILSTNLGQPISFERYATLQAMRNELPAGESLEMQWQAETRSGSAVAGVSSREGDDRYVAVLKDGEKRKLKAEREGVQSWHEVYPGLAPRILAYRKRGESAALLIEHISGLTFEQIVLNEPEGLLDETLDQLGKTLRSVWRETRSSKPIAAGFMEQLESRMPAVFDVHPEFQHGGASLCGHKLPSYARLVKRARRLDRTLKAPFSVYIHGDFNVDNIIYDPQDRRINFIDLHRSRQMDYVQDVSVFMVSNYRLQIMDAAVRQRLMLAAVSMYRMARRFARKEKDATFELRLALALARSFASSTRFILDKSMAERMFLRSRYLLELALRAADEEIGEFRLPVKDVFSG